MIVCLWLSMGRMETNCNLKQCSLCTDAPLPLRKNRGERADFFKSSRQAPVLLKNDKNRSCFVFLLIQSIDTFLQSSEYAKEIVELTKTACKQAFLFPPHPLTPGGSGRACSQVIHDIAPCTVRVYPKAYLYLTSSSGTLRSDDGNGNATKALGLIGQLHDDVILLQLPESFSLLFSCANQNYCSLILSGIDKFK